MLNILNRKPVATVEEIHAEFDSAQDRLLIECDQILNELEIPTETKVERKAADLEALGFINSETVEQLKTFRESVKDVKDKIVYTETQAREIREMAMKYPFEKFITVDEMDRICDKYGLIHAPVANYIKDVPEKNVLEMKNRKPLSVEDGPEILYILGGIEDPSAFEKHGIRNCTISERQIRSLMRGVTDNIWRTSSVLGWFREGRTTGAYALLKDLNGVEPRYEQYAFDKCTKIDKTGLQVAAPKSHFKLDGLKKLTKYGFFKQEEIEVKDPVVFELCKNDLVRIITKWGTDDDQSYLDESLQHGLLN